MFSAVNLTNPVTITPPAHFEISNDGGTTWRKTANPITYPTPANGVLASTSIMIRLNETTVGTYSANITHVSTGAVTANMPVTGTIQSNPIPVSEPLIHYTFGINNADTLPERKAGVVPAAIVMQRMAVSDGVAAPTIPAYSPVLGMSYAPSANGLWSTASGAMGGTMNRNYYVEYKISAGANYRVRVDSMVFHLSYVSTTSSIKLGVVYSTSGFVSDSIDVSGGIGPDGQPLAAATNGGFTTPIIPVQENTATTANYRLALNDSTGVLLQAGQTLTVRTSHTCSSSSAARYVKIKDLYYVGESRNTIKVQEIEPLDIKINPNPAQDVLVLDHAAAKGDAQISIYDLTGKKMLSQVTNGVTQTRIDIHSLSNGFYLIECVDSRGGVLL